MFKTLTGLVILLTALGAVACAEDSDPVEQLLKARMASETAGIAYLVAEVEGRPDLADLKRDAEVLGAEYEYLLVEADAETQAFAQLRYNQAFPWDAEDLISTVESLLNDAERTVAATEQKTEAATREVSSLAEDLDRNRRLSARLQTTADDLTQEVDQLRRELVRREAALDRVVAMRPAAVLCQVDVNQIFNRDVRDIIGELCP